MLNSSPAVKPHCSNSHFSWHCACYMIPYSSGTLVTFNLHFSSYIKLYFSAKPVTRNLQCSCYIIWYCSAKWVTCFELCMLKHTVMHCSTDVMGLAQCICYIIRFCTLALVTGNLLCPCYTGVLITPFPNKEGKKLQRQKNLMSIYPIYNHNSRNISAIYVYKARLASNEILSPSKKFIGK